MWFWFSVLALLAWSGSDLFSKIGCVDAKDKYSHLKMAMAVGIVMGIHAAYEILVGGVEVTAEVFIKYLPVSALYILSMTIGYLGLRYIELSVSSPICNSSGAIVAILTIILGGGFSEIHPVALIAVALVSIGVIALGFVESNEDEELRAERQSESGHKYAKNALALILPVIYCLLDALGTFADSRVLEVLDEDAANTAYELTFSLVGLVCFAFLLIKKQKFTFRAELPKYTGAVFETIGQFFYIYALADSRHVAFAAPIISSYCVASVIWSRLFLKEKLSKKHYAAIVTVIAGVIILGILDI